MHEATTTVPHALDEIKLTKKDLVRFWSKVDKNGPIQPHMESPCWLWTAAKSSTGYGQIWFKKTRIKTHRTAWLIVKGGILNGICVCHRCDNPACVNPDHLFLGSHADNMHDMAAKGRHGSQTKPERRARGDRHGSRLHPERLARGDNHYSRLHPSQLARGDRHGSHTHPEKWARGDKSGSRLHPERRPRGEANGSAKLTDTKVIDIRAKHAAGGFSQRQLAAQFNVSRTLVRLIINKKIWQHILP